MKYEAVFGNQELFDGAGTFTGLDVVVHSVASGIKSYARLSDLTPESLINHPVCAMRRIIAEPKHWTWEDKKAGRAPEVGSIFTYRDETLTCHFIDGDGEIWAHDIDNKIVTPLLRDCQPIETPEEKVQREQEEFVASFNYEKYSNPTLYREGLRDAYRKLKGGE